MLAKVISGSVLGLEGQLITVEVDITKKGFGAFKIVGLPSKAVDEAKDRVHTAIENSGLEFTKYRLTVNLAPADLPKEGPLFDLPIAIAILLAMEKIPLTNVTPKMLFAGELSLDGKLQPTPGILPLALLAKEQGISEIFVPEINAKEASLVGELNVYPVSNLKDLILHLTSMKLIDPISKSPTFANRKGVSEILLEDIQGQPFAKRALTIAAAGGHNILFTGPPGSGKTMLARTLPSLLPPLTFAEALEVSKIYSITNLLDAETPLIETRPFRTPHHTTSRVGLIGGGPYLTPGEISLAHRGVLFLDEIPEFPRSTLESLRQPLEEGVVTVTRARGSVKFPARFMLVAAANPCPCGYQNSQKRACTCSAKTIYTYQRRMSGPLLDRIDVHVFVKDVSAQEIMTVKEGVAKKAETETAYQQILAARTKQVERFCNEKILTNAEMTARNVQRYCALKGTLLTDFTSASEKLGLSGRAMHKTLKVARTIADLAGSSEIEQSHLNEAFQYRNKSLIS